MNYNPFSLKDKTILVTGASSGIGRATALECSRLGASVILTGRSAERLQETFDRLEGSGHRQIVAELTSGDDLDKLVGECPELTGLVLSAGRNRAMPFTLCSPEDFAKVREVNFTAPVELLRRLLRNRRIAEHASVVFVSSVAGTRGGVAAGNVAYGTSKAALDAAMRYFVREFSPRGIRFNSVNPGMVNTPFVRPVREKMTPEQIAADLRNYPLGRYGEPNDIAHGIVYLLSEASAWVTGHQLVIDGGLTV